MDIVSLFSSHIGNQKRREAYERIANDRFDELQEENKALKKEIAGIQEYAINTAQMVNGQTRLLEKDLNTVLEYNQKMQELFHALKDRILLLSSLVEGDGDPDELRQQFRFLVECVLQDEEIIRQHEEDTKRIHRSKPIEFTMDIGGVDGD